MHLLAGKHSLNFQILYGLVTQILLSAAYVASAPCRKTLGMQSGLIPDSAISASSSYDHASVGPSNARIRTERNGGAWCPKSQINKNVYEWLEIDLREMKTVTQVETQGRFGNGQGQEYAATYRLEYKRRDGGNWVRYQDRLGNEIFPGNSNTYIAELRDIVPPIVARWIRIIPHSNHPRTVCMRVELYGCPWRDGIMAYSVRQGERKGAEVDLFDFTYDQNSTNGYLSGGLGQLTDGIEGHSNFRLDPENRGRKGYEWVGWKNDSSGSRAELRESHESMTDSGQSVEIILTFDRVRNFSSIMFHCNNMFSKDVRVFREAVLHFSINGRDYQKTPVVFEHRTDNLVEFARNVVIPIPHRIGRFLKVQLHFDSRWMLISEIRIESEPFRGATFPDDVTDVIIAEVKSERIEHGSTADQLQFDGGALEAGKSIISGQSYSLLFISLVAVCVIIVIFVCIALILVRYRTFGKKPSNCITLKVDRINEFEYKSNPFGSANPASFQSFGAIANMENSVNKQLCDDYLNGTINYNKTDDVIQTSTYGLQATPYNVLCNNSDTMTKQSGTSPYRTSPYRPLNNQKVLEYRQLPDLPVIPAKSAEYYSDTNTSTYARPDALRFTPDSMSGDRTSVLACGPASTSLECDVFSSNIPSSIHAASLYSSTDFSDGLEGHCGSSLYAVPAELGIDPQASYPDISPELEVPFSSLQFVKILGTGRYGEVRLCELHQEFSGERNSLVAVKILNLNPNGNTRYEFLKEAAVMSHLDDGNIVSLVGVCTQGEPCCIITEYMPYGDLHQFLLQHQPLETASHLIAPNIPTLSHGSLIYMAMQISSGMKYLENLKVVHRDIATRNCLVGRYFAIKISDFGMSRSLYSRDYYRLEGRAALPIRWMAWESISLGKFSTMSDVWSFGVTLWEMLDFGRHQPYSQLTDDEVIENSGRFYRLDAEPVYLLPPPDSPKEIMDLMRECWNREERRRPSSADIYMFLSRKNTGYMPEEENSPAVL